MKRIASGAVDRGIRNKQRREEKKSFEAAQSLLVLSRSRGVQKKAVEVPVHTETTEIDQTERETGMSSQSEIKGTLLEIMESELKKLRAENAELKQRLSAVHKL